MTFICYFRDSENHDRTSNLCWPEMIHAPFTQSSSPGTSFRRFSVPILRKATRHASCPRPRRFILLHPPHHNELFHTVRFRQLYADRGAHQHTSQCRDTPRAPRTDFFLWVTMFFLLNESLVGGPKVCVR